MSYNVFPSVSVKNKSKLLPYVNYPLHICSENNFPTAAGLASSAAGYACLGELLLLV